jgi:two-component system LytT family sensor kinase
LPFFLIRIRLFRELLHKSALAERAAGRYRYLFAVRAVQHLVRRAGRGSLVNVRIIAVMSGGILFGPWVVSSPA